MKPTQEQINSAIETLILAGESHYNNPDEISRAKKFGIGVNTVEGEPTFLLSAAAEVSEDWNGHVEAGIIRSLMIGNYKFDKAAKTATFDI